MTRLATGATLDGTVIDNGTPDKPFYCVAFVRHDAEYARRLARQGVAFARGHPGTAHWRVSAPRAWRMYRIGPHVTLDQAEGRRLLGRRMRVVLGRKKSVDTGRSRWVMYDVALQRMPGARPFRACGAFPCHLSIAQERLVGSSPTEGCSSARSRARSRRHRERRRHTEARTVRHRRRHTEARTVRHRRAC